ncbi:hypothetical protein HPB50_020062 [Hyalomma asiaticum]|uniref:Uncharacterized protein n=1 Tax=Hyalomma asiaticum TaxID=266040 RepID=A0ACB7SAZ0_HYAAI|nr:hypothetical protein HPB50_020062 [Hyalomma asiaticum]
MSADSNARSGLRMQKRETPPAAETELLKSTFLTLLPCAPPRPQGRLGTRALGRGTALVVPGAGVPAPPQRTAAVRFGLFLFVHFTFRRAARMASSCCALADSCSTLGGVGARDAAATGGFSPRLLAHVSA